MIFFCWFGSFAQLFQTYKTKKIEIMYKKLNGTKNTRFLVIWYTHYAVLFKCLCGCVYYAPRTMPHCKHQRDYKQICESPWSAISEKGRERDKDKERGRERCAHHHMPKLLTVFYEWCGKWNLKMGKRKKLSIKDLQKLKI